MDPRSSLSRGQRVNARKSQQSGGGRSRGRRSQQRPGGGGQRGFPDPNGEPLGSIRSEATAAPQAPPSARPTPPPARPLQPRGSQPRGASARQTRTSQPRSANPGAGSPARSGARLAPGASGAQAARQAAQQAARQASQMFAPPWRSFSGASARFMRSLRGLDPGIFDYVQTWLADRAPFHWRERARRRVSWRRRATPVIVVAVGVLLAVFLGNIGISVMRQVTQAFANAAALTANQQPATPGSVIIAPSSNNFASSPTPSAAVYTVGVWTSNATPGGGAVTVYVRVSHTGLAVPKTKVYLRVSIGGPGGGYRMGPYTTDAYGMATIHLNYGAGGGAPVFLTAYTTIAGQTISGDYTFVAL